MFVTFSLAYERDMKLEDPLDFGWKMKTLKSAQTNFSITESGVLHLTIEHETLKGITPYMLE
jgi:hypothetical protein